MIEKGTHNSIERVEICDERIRHQATVICIGFTQKKKSLETLFIRAQICSYEKKSLDVGIHS